MHQQPTNADLAKNRRYLSPLAAMLVGGLLLGGYFWLIPTKSSPPHLASTPVASTLGPENVYMARTNHVVKLDGRTGAILWQHTLTPPGVNSPQTCLQIVDGVMYAILDYDSYAFRTSDGKELWHISIPSTQSKNLSCHVEGSRIYILHRDGTFTALNTKDGVQLWRSTVVLTDSMVFEVQRDTLYSVQMSGTLPRLSALDTKTGKERWHVDQQEGLPLVANGIAYTTSSNMLSALDEATGHLLWQQHTDNQAISFALSTLADGVLYAQTSTSDLQVGGECQTQPPALVCQADTYHVYAFDAKKGTLLWKSAPGRQLYSDSRNENGQAGKPRLPLVNGVVMVTSFQDRSHYPATIPPVLYALDARSGMVRWQSDQQCYGKNCGPFPATLEGGYLNLLEEGSQTNSLRLLTIDIASGRKLGQQIGYVPSPGKEVELVGMDNGRVYVLAKGNEQTLDVIHALSLANGAELWHYHVENYASGSIETPIVAP